MWGSKITESPKKRAKLLLLPKPWMFRLNGAQNAFFFPSLNVPCKASTVTLVAVSLYPSFARNSGSRRDNVGV